MNKVLTRTVQVQKNTNAHWLTLNPVLSPNEGTFSTDTSILKIGDGATRWSDLEPSNVFPNFGPGDESEYLSLSGGTIAGSLTVNGAINTPNLDVTTAEADNVTVNTKLTSQTVQATTGNITNIETSSLKLNGYTITIS